MKIRAGNLCEICNGAEIENINWFTGASRWVNGPSAPQPLSTGTYTTTSIGGASVNIPMTITTITSSTKKLKATWTSVPAVTAWTGVGAPVQIYPGHYTISSNTGGLPTGTTTTVSSPHPIPLPCAPMGIHCSTYIAKKEQPVIDHNGEVWMIQGSNIQNTKFMPNGTIGLVVHVDNDIARVLIEERLYLVPVEKLKVIS